MAASSRERRTAEGKRDSEIAAELGIKVATVRKHRSRGRAALHAILQRD